MFSGSGSCYGVYSYTSVERMVTGNSPSIRTQLFKESGARVQLLNGSQPSYLHRKTTLGAVVSHTWQ